MTAAVGAQQKLIGIGIKAGLSVSMTSLEHGAGPGAGSGKAGSEAGGTAGIFFQAKLGEKLIFQPELIVAFKGFSEVRDNYTFRNNITYLELPLQLIYKAPSPKAWFLAGGGLAPSMYIGQNILSSGYADALKKIDIGIVASAGIGFAAGFNGTLSYTHGLANVSNNHPLYEKIKNRNIGITIGYLF